MSCLPVVCFYLAKRAEDFPPPTDEVRRERDRERRPAARRASVVALERQRRDSLTLQPAWPRSLAQKCSAVGKDTRGGA